jgi:chemotaxis protein CheX
MSMSDITEQEIKVFLDAVDTYFSQITKERAAVRAAYLADGEHLPQTYDFTGLIAVSGQYRGCLYFSAPAVMLRHLLLVMEEPSHSDENFLDAVGEIANTLAGNSRKHFGETMAISVPVTMKGAPERIKSSVRARPYVIMVSWKKYNASLVVDIERND